MNCNQLYITIQVIDINFANKLAKTGSISRETALGQNHLEAY